MILVQDISTFWLCSQADLFEYYLKANTKENVFRFSNAQFILFNCTKYVSIEGVKIVFAL